MELEAFLLLNTERGDKEKPINWLLLVTGRKYINIKDEAPKFLCL